MKNSISLKYILAPFIAFGVVLAILLSGVLQSSVADAQQAPANFQVVQTQKTQYSNRLQLTWNAVQGNTEYHWAIQNRPIDGRWNSPSAYRPFPGECNRNRQCYYNGIPGREYKFFIKAGENGTPAQAKIILRLPTVTGIQFAYVSDSTAQLTWTSLPPLKGLGIRDRESSNYHYRIAYKIQYQRPSAPNTWITLAHTADNRYLLRGTSGRSILGITYKIRIQAVIQVKLKTAPEDRWQLSSGSVFKTWSNTYTYTNTRSATSGQDNNQGSSTNQPDNPTNIRITPSATSIRFEWDAVDGADSYQIYGGKSTGGSSNTQFVQGGGEPKEFYAGSETSATISGLSSNTEYAFIIRAKKSSNQPRHQFSGGVLKATRTTASTSTPTSLPAPQSLRVTNKTSNAFTVLWNPVQTSGTVRYTIQCSTGTSYDNNNNIVNASTTQTIRYVGNVTPNTTNYYCQVKAVAGSRESQYSGINIRPSGSTGQDNNQNPSSAPGQVQGLSVTSGSGNDVNLNWTAITGATYEVQSRRIDGNNFYSWNNAGTVSGSRAVVSESSGTVWVYRVRAKNDQGAGLWSDFASANSNVVLTIPQNIRTTVTPNSESVTVNWNPVSGSNIAYNIAYREADTNNVWAWASTDQRSRTITVPYGKTYEIIVRARKSNTTQGIWSEPVRVTNTGSAPPPVTPPPPSLQRVSGIATTERTTSSISLSWDSQTNATYDVRYCSRTTTCPTWTERTASSHQIQLTGLDADTEYSVAIRAKRGSTPGPWPAQNFHVSTEPDPISPLQRVSGIATTERTTSSISLSWNSQTNATYDVWYCVYTSCATWTESTASSNQKTISNLTANTEYAFIIRAKRGSTLGPWPANNEFFRARTQEDSSGGDDPPPPPPLQRVSGIATTERTTSSISLSWNSQTNATYDVWYCVYTSCATWTESTASSNQKTISNLTANTEYAFIIRAKRGSTLGPWPANNEFFRARTQEDSSGGDDPPPPPPGVPPQVQGVSYRAVSSTELSVVWNDITGATYDVEYVQDGQSNWQRIETSNITTRISNLSPSTTYVIRVRANNAQGAGDWSGIVRGATLAGATTSLPQVTGLRSTRINDTSVDLIWNPVAGVQYEVRRTSATNSTPTVTPAPQNFTTVQCLNPSTQYFFTVRALNSNGQTGTWSEIIPATTAPRGQSPDFSINTGTTNCPPVSSGPTPPPPTRPSNFRDGDIVRVPGTYDVYILKMIDGKKFKRLILNPQIFDSYGHLRWENIKDITRQDLQSFVTSNLVREVYANGQAVNNNIYALYPQGDVGTKRLVTGGYYDSSSVYNINHLEAGDSFYATGQPVNLASGDYGISVATAPQVQVVSTRPTIINIQYNATPNTTEYLVEWRVRYSNNNFWSFKTNRTTASIWGNVTPNTEYEIYVTPLSATGAVGVKSAPVYARSS